MSVLFEPLVIGDLEIPNRIIMAPMTRCRSGNDRVPNDLMAEYYGQRASAGLIISEATSVDPMGVGYPDTPGIWSDEQVEGWKKITGAVHDKGGKIFIQLWHVGRISHPVYLDGALTVAPSAIRPDGFVNQLRPKSAFETPRALETEEIPGIIGAYRKGAENAKKAGFDGVEIHGANGYLLEQFLAGSTNQRTDEYGGSIENRARLMLEITDAAIDIWGKERVGMHLSPRMDRHDLNDRDREELFSHVARELGRRGIAFIFTREYPGDDSISPVIKRAFGGVLIANENLSKQSAEELTEKGAADAAAFGRIFIANPDLPKRLERNADLNTPEMETFYSAGEKGFTDYPFL